MDQVVQVAGALLIPIAFAGAQSGWLSPHSLPYLLLNVVGSAVLAAVVLHGADWGFLLLEAVWALVSVWGLVQLLRGRTPSPTG